MMKYHYALNEIIPFLPYVKKGKYNKNIGTFILVGGSGYKSIYFDKFIVNEDDNFYRKFKYEVEYPNINFQERLSKISATFSFDRPTDLLNHNLYSDENYNNIYIASLKDLTIKNYALFMNNLFIYRKIKPPYIFIAMSEGGHDVLCFTKYYNNLVKQIYFIDTPFLGSYMETFEKFRKNNKLLNNVREKKFSWKKTNKMELLNEEELMKVDAYNFEIKTCNIIGKLRYDNLPITIIWSPYFDSATKKCLIKIKIINQINKELKKFNNINYFIVNAPHQVERVLPITLFNIISNTII